MDENLVGYLLDALEPAEMRQMANYLRDRPQAERRLQLLERAFEPLAADRDNIEPPAGLAVRTLALVAEHRCRELPRVPEATIRRSSAFTHHSWWRRADVLVAASLLFCAALLVPPALTYVRYREQVTVCANSLNVVGKALDAYSDHHDGNFPNVADPYQERPVAAVSEQAAAGMVMPMLVSNGVLNPYALTVLCPGSGGHLNVGASTMQMAQNLSPEEFDQFVSQLMPAYAYTLGYEVKGGQVAGINRSQGRVPVMSDAPPFTAGTGPISRENSRNHLGRGQNVLFTDGSVIFLRGRIFKIEGSRGDDIYVNLENQIRAGKGPLDFVLGPSGAHP